MHLGEGQIFSDGATPAQSTSRHRKEETDTAAIGPLAPRSQVPKTGPRSRSEWRTSRAGNCKEHVNLVKNNCSAPVLPTVRFTTLPHYAECAPPHEYLSQREELSSGALLLLATDHRALEALQQARLSRVSPAERGRQKSGGQPTTGTAAKRAGGPQQPGTRKAEADTAATGPHAPRSQMQQKGPGDCTEWRPRCTSNVKTCI